VKNQYFGDQTDYIKHGILRGICKRAIPLGIHWNLTLDDASTDGSRTAYLSATDRWRHYDPELYDVIRSSLASGRRTLQVLVERNLLPGAVLCFDAWDRDSRARRHNLEAFMGQLLPNSLVFLDPDNGLEVASIPSGAPASSKYVYFDEVRQIWDAGHSLFIYQHFPRVNRRTYVRDRLRQLVSGLSYSHAFAVVTSHVVFLGVLQGTGAERSWRAMTKSASHWVPHTQLLSLTENSSLVDIPLASLTCSPQAELSL
jgi:hypothetical protein